MQKWTFEGYSDDLIEVARESLVNGDKFEEEFSSVELSFKLVSESTNQEATFRVSFVDPSLNRNGWGIEVLSSDFVYERGTSGVYADESVIFTTPDDTVLEFANSNYTEYDQEILNTFKNK